MVDVWQPANADSGQPDLTLLQTLAGLSDAIENNTDISDIVSDDELTLARSWIQLSEENWQTTIEALNTENRLGLAFFYTLAEMKLSGWEARDKNPAIWIFRYLKKNKQLPEKEIIKLLKSKTDNRFIPYGSVL